MIRLGLASEERRRIDIVALPIVDLDENALMVNALQRQTVLSFKKSLQEGFGWTTELRHVFAAMA